MGRKMVENQRNRALNNGWAMMADGEVPVGRLKAYGEKGAPAKVLGLRDLRVTTQIEGLIARTTIQHVFQNDTDSVLEGVFTFHLPGDVAVDRFAMTIYSESDLMEASLVDRQTARSVYERVVYGQSLDPGYLEWLDAHTFRATIFPIPPRGTKTIVLSYLQTLTRIMTADGASEVTYVYPMRTPDGAESPLPAAAHVSLFASVHGFPAGSVVEPTLDAQAKQGVWDDVVLNASLGNGEAPKDDWVVTIRTPATGAQAAQAAECQLQAYRPVSGKPGRFALTLTPQAELASIADPVDVLFVVDTSANRRGSEYTAAKRIVYEALRRLRAEDRFALVAFDILARTLDGGWQSPSDDNLEKAGAFLEKLQPMGATDVAGAFRTIEMDLAQGVRERARVVFLGDAEATYGARNAGELKTAVERTLEKLNAEMYAVWTGEGLNAPALPGEPLAKLARLSAGPVLRLGRDVDPRLIGERLGSRLGMPVLRDVKVKLELANGSECEFVEPVAGGIAANVSTTLFGVYKLAGEATVKLDAMLGGKPYSRAWKVKLPAVEARNVAVGRLWARAKIGALEGQPEEASAVALEHKVLSRNTSFLVLESERMYQDFNISRPNKEQQRYDLASRTIGGGIESTGPAEARAPRERRMELLELRAFNGRGFGAPLSGPVDVGGVRVNLSLQGAEVTAIQEAGGKRLSTAELMERRLGISRQLASARGLPFEAETAFPQLWLSVLDESADGRAEEFRARFGSDEAAWKAVAVQPAASPKEWRPSFEAPPAREQQLARLMSPLRRSYADVSADGVKVSLDSHLVAHQILSALLKGPGAHQLHANRGDSEVMRLIKTQNACTYRLEGVAAESRIAAWNFLSQLLLAEGQSKPALELAERALAEEDALRTASDPRPARLSRLLAGLACQQRARYEEAAMHYRRMLETSLPLEDAGRDMVYWSLVTTMVEAGDRDGAILVLERWCYETQYRLDLCEELGKFYRQVNRFDDAIRACSTPCEFNPDLGLGIVAPQDFVPAAP
ncbi:MAG: VIT domain-containing protein [Planctomycetota bacterium]|nr:VIT domain-containing protein [Planctomycetota bacterium]